MLEKRTCEDGLEFIGLVDAVSRRIGSFAEGKIEYSEEEVSEILTKLPTKKYAKSDIIKTLEEGYNLSEEESKRIIEEYDKERNNSIKLIKKTSFVKKIPCYALSIGSAGSSEDGSLLCRLIGEAVVENGETSALYIWKNPSSMFEELPSDVTDGQIEMRQEFYNNFKGLNLIKKVLYSAGLINFEALHKKKKNSNTGKIISISSNSTSVKSLSA